MKMIILILKDHLTDAVTSALTGAQYRVTRVASTGGFLHSGVATLLIGADDSQVDPAISLIRGAVAPKQGAEPEARLFVVPVSRFEQI